MWWRDASAVAALFLDRFDLVDDGIDFFWLELVGKLRHALPAVSDYVAQVIGGHAGGFLVDQRRSGEHASVGRFAVALGAVFLENGIRGQRCLWFGLGVRGSGDQRRGYRETEFLQGHLFILREVSWMAGGRDLDICWHL